MLRLIVLTALVALASAQGYRRVIQVQEPQLLTYQPVQRVRNGYSDDLAEPTPYSFSYDIKNEHGAMMNREESGDGYGNVQGAYGYMDSYGIFRQVEYTADDYGFRANIKTNEPGTANQNSADVTIHAAPVEVKEAPRRAQILHRPVQRTHSYAPSRY